MKVLVLGGCGIQGRAALYDLSRNTSVDHVTCADIQPELFDTFDFIDKAKIQVFRIDANDPNALASKMDEKFDVVLDFLPSQSTRTVAEAAIKSGVHLVNTNYAYDILDLDDAAKERGISIIPECGLDPGIDLVLYKYSLKYFDEVFKLNSYCGGIPEKAACDNPLKYKISWNMSAVLQSQVRDAMLIADSEIISIPAQDQHENAFIHHIEFPGLGTLEAIPNGNAVRYAKLLKIADTLYETGRYALRWPGWCSFWAPLKKFGFLSDEPVKGVPGRVSPLEMVAKLLEPQLQYSANEKDLCVMVNKVEGVSRGKQQILTCSLMIERDLSTGLMAMSMGVAYPACIAAEMIVRGDITRTGVLSPATDVPCDLFMNQLNKRGIRVNEKIELSI
ncbi:MAG: saccharopine dehydrogenase NADP-binding domain-containing protein [Deltaproteobacteria bacterium]|nr:saccharopine dehydrogenase NADP-binding domain-containing protein [Deltaproteobacteria bacterium]